MVFCYSVASLQKRNWPGAWWKIDLRKWFCLLKGCLIAARAGFSWSVPLSAGTANTNPSCPHVAQGKGPGQPGDWIIWKQIHYRGVNIVLSREWGELGHGEHKGKTTEELNWGSSCAGSPTARTEMGINVWGGSGPWGMLKTGFEQFGTHISIRLSQLHSQYSLAWQKCGVCGQLLETEGVESEDNTERGIYAVILSLLPLFMYPRVYLYSYFYIYLSISRPYCLFYPWIQEIPKSLPGSWLFLSLNDFSQPL